MLGEGRILLGANRFQVEGTATILREDIKCSRPWPKPHKHIIFDLHNHIGKYSHFTGKVR